MCDRCKGKHKTWVHIADTWTQEERNDMKAYLYLYFPTLGSSDLFCSRCGKTILHETGWEGEDPSEASKMKELDQLETIKISQSLTVKALWTADRTPQLDFVQIEDCIDSVKVAPQDLLRFSIELRRLYEDMEIQKAIKIRVDIHKRRNK